VIHHGAYKTLNQSYQLVLKGIEANGYQVGGPFREIYLHYGKPVRQDDPSYVTEIGRRETGDGRPWPVAIPTSVFS
jgi:effector-binding domain-containing protein